MIVTKYFDEIIKRKQLVIFIIKKHGQKNIGKKMQWIIF